MSLFSDINTRDVGRTRSARDFQLFRLFEQRHGKTCFIAFIK